MSNRAKKTEHAGHKGSTRKTGYWGHREDAKRESNSARRLEDRRIVQDYAPDPPEEVIHVGGYFTGSKEGDENLFQYLGSIGALGGAAKQEYETQRKEEEEE